MRRGSMRRRTLSTRFAAGDRQVVGSRPGGESGRKGVATHGTSTYGSRSPGIGRQGLRHATGAGSGRSGCRARDHRGARRTQRIGQDDPAANPGRTVAADEWAGDPVRTRPLPSSRRAHAARALRLRAAAPVRRARRARAARAPRATRGRSRGAGRAGRRSTRALELVGPRRSARAIASARSPSACVSASCWPRRCSRRRSCWCSTNPSDGLDPLAVLELRSDPAAPARRAAGHGAARQPPADRARGDLRPACSCSTRARCCFCGRAAASWRPAAAGVRLAVSDRRARARAPGGRRLCSSVDGRVGGRLELSDLDAPDLARVQRDPRGGRRDPRRVRALGRQTSSPRSSSACRRAATGPGMEADVIGFEALKLRRSRRPWIAVASLTLFLLPDAGRLLRLRPEPHRRRRGLSLHLREPLLLQRTDVHAIRLLLRQHVAAADLPRHRGRDADRGRDSARHLALAPHADRSSKSRVFLSKFVVVLRATASCWSARSSPSLC